MSTVWLVFVLITGRILATSTLFADRFAAATHRPRRFVWLAGLIATVVWPAIAFGVLHLATIALVHGWGIGHPRNAALIELSIPRGLAPSWLDTMFLVAWAGASAVLSLRLIIGGLATSRWRRSLPMVDVDGVHVRLCRDAGPAVVGVFTTDLVLPTWTLALDPGARSLILRHELSHRDARDTQLFWCAVVLPVLVPWNVFTWWQASRLRLAIEMDCDARVLRDDARPIEYAKLLVSIAERWKRAPQLPALAPALLGQASRLEYRLAAITEEGRRRSPARSALYLLAAALGLALAIAIETPTTPLMRSTLARPAVALRHFPSIGR